MGESRSERIIVSYLEMTERQVMGERVRSSKAREIGKNGEARGGGRLMEEGCTTENELVCCWRVNGGSDSCID